MVRIERELDVSAKWKTTGQGVGICVIWQRGSIFPHPCELRAHFVLFCFACIDREAGNSLAHWKLIIQTLNALPPKSDLDFTLSNFTHQMETP